MIINTLNDLDQVNQICYQQFLDLDPNKNYDSSFNFIPFDFIASNIVATGNYNSLKNCTDTYREWFTAQPQVIFTSEIARIIDLYSQYSDDSPVYLYPSSKKEFIETYFANIIPTLSSYLFDLMKSTGRLIQIGAGQGKAFIIKPSLFTEFHFSSAPSGKLSSEIISSITNDLSLLSSSLIDIDYYIEQINKKDEIINSLNNYIESLNSQINHVYQTTWR
jgi:hypothetical protein